MIEFLAFSLRAFRSCPQMPTRRLEDRIRELCARVLYETGTDWQKTVHQLQAAIREHALRLTNKTAAATVGGKPEVIIERRDRSTAKTGTND